MRARRRPRAGTDLRGTQSVPHVAAPSRGRGSARGGAAAAAWEAAAVEIAAQRARDEADRFRLPTGLAERVNTRELDGPLDEEPAALRKRKRIDDRASLQLCRCAIRAPP